MPRKVESTAHAEVAVEPGASGIISTVIINGQDFTVTAKDEKDLEAKIQALRAQFLDSSPNLP